MTDVLSVPEAEKPPLGLLARIVGIVFTPRQTYAAVVARPRVLGILTVTLLVIVVAVALFLRTEVGQQAALDQNLRTIEALGINIPDEAYARMEDGMSRAWITGAIGQVAFWLPAMAILAGLLTGVFTTLLDGKGRYKQVFAVVAHASVIVALQQAFSMSLSYAKGAFAGATLGAFLPMLEETNFAVRFLNAIDLFVIWWIVSVAIGLGVLYKRRTGGIAASLLGVYVCIALIVAFWRSGS
jgi:hypothetical protein